MKSATQVEPVEHASPAGKPGSRALRWAIALGLLAATAAFAWFRTGMLDLPNVPPNLTLDAAGLSGLEQMKQLNDAIWSSPPAAVPSQKPRAPGDAADLVRSGIAAYRRGETKDGLELMRQGIRLEPGNLVLANAYRMVVFALRRDFLASARRASVLAPRFPAELERQPIVFFEELDRRHGTARNETRPGPVLGG